MESVAVHQPLNAPPEFIRLARRFFWKEVRMCWGLAAGILGVALLAMLVVMGILPSQQLPTSVMVVAIGGAALFAVAASVTLFAVEREEGTALLLQTLPQNRASLFAGKLAAALAVTLLLLAVLVLAGLAIAGGQLPTETARAMLVQQGVVAILEAFVLGTLASLLCPQPLLAAVIGVTAASLNAQLAIALTLDRFAGYQLEDYQEAIPGRLALLAVAALANVWIGMRWLRIKPTIKPRWRRVSSASDDSTTATPHRLPWRSLFVRLVWQTVRESYKNAIAAVFVGFALSLAITLILESTGMLGISGLAGVLFTPALLGAMVFRSDQRGRSYRFLAEHAGRPRTVWLTRQTFWLALLTILMAVPGVRITAAIFESFWYQLQVGTAVSDRAAAAGVSPWILTTVAPEVVLLVIAATYTAYAFGQLCSMAVRSNVLAGMLALFASVLIVGWAVLAGLWRLPALWFVAPLGCGAMLASWLRVRDWVFDRGGIVRWLPPAVATLLPIVAVLWATPATRRQQVEQEYFIANRQQAFVVDKNNIITTSSELFEHVERVKQQQARGRELADAYNRAELGDTEKFIELSRFDGRLPAEYAPRSERASAIVRRIDAVYPRQLLRKRNGKAVEVSRLEQELELLLACRRVEIQRMGSMPFDPDLYSHLDTIYDLGAPFLNWATTKGQEPELILRAVAELQKIDATLPNPTDRLINNYLVAESSIDEWIPISYASDGSVTHSVWDWTQFLLNQFPGEKERSELALRNLAMRASKYVGTLDALLYQSPEQATFLRSLLLGNGYEGHAYRLETLIPGADNRLPWNLLYGQADQAVHSHTSYLVSSAFLDDQQLLRGYAQWLARTARWQAQRLRLALIAYRLREGDYPESLNALVPDYLSNASHFRDPYTAEPFSYSRDGFDSPVVVFQYQRSNDISPETPMLWCGGFSAAAPAEVEWLIEYNAGGELVGYANAEDDLSAPGNVIKKECVTTLPGAYHWDEGAFWLPLP